jgi:hypothetical protein
MKRPEKALVESTLFLLFWIESNPTRDKNGRRKRNLANAKLWEL